MCQISKGLIIKVNKYKRAITPGQYAVLSKDGECLGGARIINTGVSHFSLYYLENNNLANVSHILKKYVTKVSDDEDDLTDNEDMKHSAANYFRFLLGLLDRFLLSSSSDSLSSAE